MNERQANQIIDRHEQNVAGIKAEYEKKLTEAAEKLLHAIKQIEEAKSILA